MKITDKERIKIRKEIVEEANKVGNIFDDILRSIHNSETEKQSSKLLKKLRLHLDVFKRQNFNPGRSN